jgi:hypothetical protein
MGLLTRRGHNNPGNATSTAIVCPCNEAVNRVRIRSCMQYTMAPSTSGHWNGQDL